MNLKAKLMSWMAAAVAKALPGGARGRRRWWEPIPAPEVGQVWKSLNSGSLIKVAKVEVNDYGATEVRVELWLPADHWLVVDKAQRAGAEPQPGWSGMTMDYGRSLPEWRWLINHQRRELIWIEPPTPKGNT